MWESIIAACKGLRSWGLDFFNSFSQKLSAGSEASWWDKAIARGQSLKERFPRIFAMEMDQQVPFNQRWVWENGSWRGSWNWRSDLRGRTFEEYQRLVDFLIRSDFKTTGKNRWIWNWDNKGLFTCKNLSSIIHRNLTSQARASVNSSLWSRLIPGKVNIFLWRLVNNALPTKDNLVKRGVPVPSVLYEFCISNVENTNYWFFECNKVGLTWRKICAWWNCDCSSLTSVDSFRNCSTFSSNKNFPNLIFKAVATITLWSIWKWRNSIWHLSGEDADKLGGYFGVFKT